MIASVIIPSFNRGQLIQNTLASLAEQTVGLDQFEVIIVDDGSTDQTTELVKDFISSANVTNMRLLTHSQNSGRAAACNTGIKAALAPLVLFTDDDCVVKPDWVEMHVRRHTETNGSIGVLGAVTFPDAWIQDSNFVRYYQTRYVGNRSIASVGGDLENLPPNLFGGLNISVPRDFLLAVGGYNERIGRGQDGEIAYRLRRAGLRLVFDSRPLVVHFSPEMSSFSLWLSKFVKFYETSSIILSELHPTYVDEYGHWFLERPTLNDPIKRMIVKSVIRSFCCTHLAENIKDFLVLRDNNPKFYFPILYKYVILTSCLESVKKRDKKQVSFRHDVEQGNGQ